MDTPAVLVLQDGTVLRGAGFGAPRDTIFELVFNTSMTGYQEILSDPSYRGQGVCLTTSHVGNVGINLEDSQSSRPQVSALVTRSLSRAVSNWRAAESLPDWLARHGVPAISGVDTRYLTRRLRDGGTCKAALSTCGTSPAELLDLARAWPGLDGRDTVGEATCPQPYAWPEEPAMDNPPRHVVAFDFGIKTGILRHLAANGARLTVVPAYTTLAEVLALRPDGVFLSNGPGDPAGLPGIVAVVAGLIESGLPVFGICLGHQLIGRALGGATCRLKFGHHSGNHPVQEQASGRVLITAQNHNYAVVPESLDPAAVEITHLSLNDGTLEGLRLRSRPVFSVQFHPEAAPGPHDAHGLFAQFFNLIETCAGGQHA
jgi:carbamoyl-phosphate synthase small subunit